MSCIRYEFQVGCIDMVSWRPGKLNVADIFTKPHSPLAEMIQLSFFTG